MSFKKTVAIAAAAGALAAISVPAMALENEFHGLYNFNTTFSNFQAGASGDFFPGGTPATATAAGTSWHVNRGMNNYFEQRARIQYTAKASDDLKLVTQFEINNRFGNINNVYNTQNTTTATTDVSGSDLDSDGLTFLTKHVYLDFNVGKSFNAKLGIQPYKDTLKGLFIDADIPAVMTTTTLGAYKLGLGYTRYAEASDSAGDRLTIGDNAKDLLIWDNTYAISKDSKVALSYYFLKDDSTNGTVSPTIAKNTQLHTLGLSGETKIGALGLSGFAAMQAGRTDNTGTAANQRTTYHGYAANVAAKMAVGSGTAKAGFLFTSGNNGAAGSTNGWVGTGVNTYNEGGMMILARNTANSPTSTDTYIRRNITNIALLTMGYDAKITDKLFANANLGFAWAPASADGPLVNPLGADPVAAGGVNLTKHTSGDYMGTELNLETGYKLYSNLTLKAQVAYMMLGGYYSNTATTGTGSSATPENPYSARLHAQFSF